MTVAIKWRRQSQWQRRETYWQHAAAMTMIILLEVISEEVEIEIEKETSTNNERRCLLQLHLLFGSFFSGRKSCTTTTIVQNFRIHLQLNWDMGV